MIYRKDHDMQTDKNNQRVSARVPAHIYDTLVQAAVISGSTVNQFLVQSALEKAKIVIENEQAIKLTTQSAKSFFSAIENPPPPNKKLKTAVKMYKKSVS